MLFRDLFGSRFDEVQVNLKRLAGTEYFWAPLLEEARPRRMKGNRTEFLSEFVGLEEAVVVTENLSAESPNARRLIEFEDLAEEDEEWRRLEEDIYPFFAPFRKKRYMERLCTAVERPCDSWKLGEIDWGHGEHCGYFRKVIEHKDLHSIGARENRHGVHRV